MRPLMAAFLTEADPIIPSSTGDAISQPDADWRPERPGHTNGALGHAAANNAVGSRGLKQ